jgi:ADP-heptose:LPS heptosyltransferase
MKILISRTDSIGDVILTLPLAGILKKYIPGCQIVFLGQTYTQPVVNLSKHIDGFINYKELSALDFEAQVAEIKKHGFDVAIHVFPKKPIAQLIYKARIKTRIGTSHRWYHWLTCNKLLHFSRKNSNLHEAQLNIKLLAPLGIKKSLSIAEIANLYGFQCNFLLKGEHKKLLSSGKKNIILHPKSKGSAVEWGLENFAQLILLLPPEKFNIFISGTEDEGKLFRKQLIEPFPQVQDMSGKFSLEEFIAFIGQSHAMIAASTGPLHIAAALGVFAVGLFPPHKPIHPGRWQPIGKHTKILLLYPENQKNSVPSLMAQEVFAALNDGLK